MAGSSTSAGLVLSDSFREWGIHDAVITKSFVDNGITIDILMNLTDDNLKELCPHMATRILLRNKISERSKSDPKRSTVPTEINDKTSHPHNNNDDISFENEADLINPFPDFDLEKLLADAPEGDKIKHDYEKNYKLSSRSQQQLTDIICRQLYPWLKSENRLKCHHYAVLLRKIKILFPHTSTGVFYSSPVTAKLSVTGKFIPARGKLPDKVKNILYDKNGNKRKRSESRVNKDSNEEIIADFKIKHQESLQWLQRNRNPWTMVVEKWTETLELRRIMICSTINEYLEEWNIFNDQRSVKLISLDFSSMYPGKEELFKKNWDTFFDKMKLLKAEKYSASKVIKPLKEKLAKLGSDEKSQNRKLLIEMQILAHLIPPKSRRSKMDKIATQESMDDIFIYAQTASDVEEKIKKQKDDHFSRDETVQPYLIVQGSSDDWSQILLVIDHIRYEFKSTFDAFDCLFKLYHVFHAKYPKAGFHLYLLIQRCIYQVVTKFDYLPINRKDSVETFEKTM